jgi:thymidylate synthase ThyX
MSISAKIICDSISPEGIRLTSFEVEFHRWILAEVNTHRMLSRNYRSSRAVPVAKLIQEVQENPAMPITWLKNRPGMVATEPMTTEEKAVAIELWVKAAYRAAEHAEALIHYGLHKQWANRLLEPFLFAKGVITATDWANFFALRRAPDAQPEFKALADLMHNAMEFSTPVQLQPGEWHLPYVSDEELDLYRGLTDPSGVLRKISTARLARVSVKPFDGETTDINKDIELHDRLFSMKHMSPFEHMATPDNYWRPFLNEDTEWENPGLHGNFHGWIQYRKTLYNEHIPG